MRPAQSCETLQVGEDLQGWENFQVPERHELFVLFRVTSWIISCSRSKNDPQNHTN